jgi:hypothetical protein
MGRLRSWELELVGVLAHGKDILNVVADRLGSIARELGFGLRYGRGSS